jgi:hypothetical protein
MLEIEIVMGIWFGISLGAMSIPLASILGKKIAQWIFGPLARRMLDKVVNATLAEAPRIERSKAEEHEAVLIHVRGHVADGVRYVD